MAKNGENGKRLLSLDTLRGLDMFFIMGGDALFLSLCALFPGTAFAGLAGQMQHSAWDGFTFYDLIFPLFLFLAGVSFPFSLAKQRSLGRSNFDVSRKVLFRAAMLVFLGMIYNGLLQFNFNTLRCASVLGRIGVAWALAAVVFVWLGRRWSVVVSLAVLLGYWALLVLVPSVDGLSPLSMEGSLVARLDRFLLPGTLHDGVHDPEGLLSTFPAMVTAMLGIFTGELVMFKGLSGTRKVTLLFLSSVVLVSVGALWGLLFPINKNLWSSSFVCYAGGWSVLLFALFYLVVDVLQLRGFTLFFRVIGLNSITIYLLQHFVDFHKLNSSLFGGVIHLFPAGFYAVAYWACYVLVCWLFLYFLYRKKIFLKV